MLRILKKKQRGKIKQLCHKIFVCLNLSSSEILSSKCFCQALITLFLKRVSPAPFSAGPL